MTTDAILIKPTRRDDPYPDAPARDDMQKTIYLHERSTVETLKEHFCNPDSILMRNEVRRGPSLSAPGDTAQGVSAWGRGCPSLSAPGDTRVPDMMVAFDCGPARVWEGNGYCLASQPIPRSSFWM